jgi:hypothetical protein
MFEKQIRTFREGIKVVSVVSVLATIAFLIVGPPVLMSTAAEEGLLPNTIIAGVLFAWLLGVIYAIGVLNR